MLYLLFSNEINTTYIIKKSKTRPASFCLSTTAIITDKD